MASFNFLRNSKNLFEHFLFSWSIVFLFFFFFVDLRVLGLKKVKNKNKNLNELFQVLNGSLILGVFRCFKDWIGVERKWRR